MRFLKQLAFILASKTYQNHVLEASWGVWGASWRPLGASWARLGASWAHVGASCRRLGASWSVFERLECVFRRLGGRFYEILLDYVTLARGTQVCLAARNPQLSRRRKPYEGNLTQKNYLQRVSAESECRE